LLALRQQLDEMLYKAQVKQIVKTSYPL
jgi:hypothetical protein